MEFQPVIWNKVNVCGPCSPFDNSQHYRISCFLCLCCTHVFLNGRLINHNKLKLSKKKTRWFECKGIYISLVRQCFIRSLHTVKGPKANFSRTDGRRGIGSGEECLCEFHHTQIQRISMVTNTDPTNLMGHPLSSSPTACMPHQHVDRWSACLQCIPLLQYQQQPPFGLLYCFNNLSQRSPSRASVNIAL